MFLNFRIASAFVFNVDIAFGQMTKKKDVMLILEELN